MVYLLAPVSHAHHPLMGRDARQPLFKAFGRARSLGVLSCLLIFIAARSASSIPAGVTAARPRVLVAPYNGIITPIAAEYLDSAIVKAEDEKLSALIIELDTPGGLDLSMRQIVKAIFSSKVPVIVYVAPAGARAASAGVFITMAAPIAAMAPGTNIGAAHPIELGQPSVGGDLAQTKDAVLQKKMTNDAAAYLKAIASKRGRNEKWAELVVSQSTSVTSGEAVKENVVDLEAADIPALLAALDGRKLADFTEPLRVKGSELSYFSMTRRQKFLAAVCDPNVAMMLMSVGVAGLLVELYSPGLIFPGVFGAAALILAFYAFETLSASYAGILFLAMGFLLFFLELHFHSLGLLALGGMASVILGSLLLFGQQTMGLAISHQTLGLAVLVMGGAAVALLILARRVLSRKSESGAEGLIGLTGVVVTPLDPEGTVQIHSEIWKAHSLSGPIAPKTEVEVVSADGLTLKVRPKKVS